MQQFRRVFSSRDHRVQSPGQRGHADAQAGGASYGARSLDVVDYTAARVAELAALQNAVRQVSGNRRVYQQLSWHQRRRTMSHSSRRMPARLRAAHRRELAAHAPPAAKPTTNLPAGKGKGKVAGSSEKTRATGAEDFVEPPLGPQGRMRCRKYRRRASFLSAYRRLRSQSPQWLETHIWHAKRFKMKPCEASHRILAECSNDRGLRSCYRTTSHASIVHDASYLDVVELSSTNGAQPICECLRAHLTPEDAAKAMTDPVMRGSRRVTGVSFHSGAGEALAPVDLLWRPVPKEAATLATTPEAHEARAGESDPTRNRKLWIWCHPAASRAVAACAEEHAEKSKQMQSTVAVELLRNEILTFQILGPKAGAVLGAVFPQVRESAAADDSQSNDDPLVAPTEWECIRGAQSAATAPPDAVLAVQVRDPRALFPPKRTGEGGRMHPESHAALALVNGTAFSCTSDSALWDAERREACSALIRQHPSARDDASSVQPKRKRTQAVFIPILVIQRRACLSRGFGSGWDVIAPKRWGMAIWTSLVYANGGRVAGQSEMRHIALESGRARFPEDYPDSQSGQAVLASLQKELAQRHERRPPSKRVNFALYRVPSPFKVDIDALVQVAGEQVVSNRGSDGQDASNIEPPRKKARAADDALPSPGVMRTARVLRSKADIRSALDLNVPSVDKWNDALVSVTLVASSRGVPLRNALLCEVLSDDVQPKPSSRSKTGWDVGEDGGFGVCEALARGQAATSPKRRTIGRVVYGDYSLVRACGIGSGVVTVSAVRAALGNEREWSRSGRTRMRHRQRDELSFRVLFRNNTSLQYRLAVAVVRAW